MTAVWSDVHMNLNKHHVIDFAIQRWDLDKTIISKDLNCRKEQLSRKEIPKFIDSSMLYQAFFDIEYNKSWASQKNENENELLYAFYYFLDSLKLAKEASLVQERMKAGNEYSKVIMEVLRLADVQPLPRKSKKKKKKLKQVEVTDAIESHLPSATLSKKTSHLEEQLGWLSNMKGNPVQDIAKKMLDKVEKK